MRGSYWLVVVVAVAAIGGGLLLFGGSDEDSDTEVAAGEEADPGAETESVIVPTLTSLAIQGRVAFVQNCAGCHGENGGGTNQGPPLVHGIYEPNHHSDTAFVLAARNGSRAHHWRFGDMPAQPHVTDVEINAIIQFVREVQRANGIF